VTTPSPPGRPGAVTAAGFVLLIGAGLGLLACCGVNLTASGADLSGEDRDLLLLASMVLIGGSVLIGVLGYAILRGRQWARITTIAICVLGIIAALVSLFTGAGPRAGGGDLLGTCVGVLLELVVIVLLSGSRVSDYFRHPDR
jgi:hypothetical protein